MKATITRALDMFERLHRFLLEFALTAAVPRAAGAHIQLLAVIAALRAAARDQISGRAHSAGGVDVRQKIWRQLRQVLTGVNRTARILEVDFPGIRAQFRLPRTRSYPKFLCAARAIAAAAAAGSMKAAFIEAGHAPDFLDEIAALLAAFDAATNQKHDGRLTQAASTAALKEQARLGILAATQLDAYARNHYRDQPEMLAAWRIARHIERTPRRAQPESITTAPAPEPHKTPAPAPAPAQTAPPNNAPEPKQSPAPEVTSPLDRRRLLDCGDSSPLSSAPFQ